LGIAGRPRPRENLLNLEAQIETKVSDALTSGEFVKELSRSQKAQLGQVLRDTAAEISIEVKESNFVSISIAKFLPESEELVYPLDAFANFGELINEVYYALDDKRQAVYVWLKLDLKGDVDREGVQKYPNDCRASSGALPPGTTELSRRLGQQRA
jgi:hypothetical protein